MPQPPASPPSPPGRSPPPLDRTRAGRRQALAAAVLALAAAALPPRLAASEDPPPVAPLAIETRSGAVHRFAIELAATPDERARGLMFRESMAPDRGMLFDFGRDQPVAMWMRNTLLPLDMLFIDAAGVIAGIAADTVPYSETVIPSPGPVRAVLELNAGTARRLGIAAGDRVRHAMFAPAG